MAEREKYGVRSLEYSRWHRTDSVHRFLGLERAHHLPMIDLDALEYCRLCSQPLLLIETARDVGQRYVAVGN